MSLYFTNINRSTDQISLKFLFAAESQIILNISLPVQRTTQPSFKRACRIRGKAPYQAYLFAIDRCFKINLTTLLPQTFRSSKFSVHSLAFSLSRSRLARIRQHSFSPKKMSFFLPCLQNIHQNAEHLTGTFNDVWCWKIRTYQYVLVASNICNIWVFPVVLLLFHQSAHDWWCELF